jgi:hypothetical protein
LPQIKYIDGRRIEEKMSSIPKLEMKRLKRQFIDILIKKIVPQSYEWGRATKGNFSLSISN